MRQETAEFLNFLAEAFERKLKWATLRGYVPALSRYLRYVDILQVKRLLKGVFNLRPPVARYTAMWDVNIVLNYMEAMVTTSFKDKSMKLATLLMILSGNRVNMLTHFTLPNMFITDKECTFVFDEVLKSTRPSFNINPMTFKAFSDRPALCPVQLIWDYLECRNQLSGDTQFFVTLKSPFNGAQPGTIARWVKEMLCLSGVQDGRYTAHSCRSASTSSALFRGISLSTIVRSASWKGVKTFKKHYLREIKGVYDLNKENFGEETLLRNT